MRQATKICPLWTGRHHPVEERPVAQPVDRVPDLARAHPGDHLRGLADGGDQALLLGVGQPETLGGLVPEATRARILKIIDHSKPPRAKSPRSHGFTGER